MGAMHRVGVADLSKVEVIEEKYHKVQDSFSMVNTSAKTGVYWDELYGSLTLGGWEKTDIPRIQGFPPITSGLIVMRVS